MSHKSSMFLWETYNLNLKTSKDKNTPGNENYDLIDSLKL